MAAQGAEKLAEIRADDPVALTVQHELELCRKDWKQKVLDLDGRAMHLSISDEQEAARLWLEVAELQLAYGEHRDAALAAGAERAPGYPLLSGIIRLGCRAAIRISERV